MYPACLDTLYGSAEMQRIFSDENRLQKMLDVEAALARATAAVGLIPEASAREISEKAIVQNLDLARLVKVTEQMEGHPVIPLIGELKRICSGDHGEFIHWGATTQDIVDTALSLQLRDAFSHLYSSLLRLEHCLVELAEKHKRSIMAGRTYGQHALPTTFGFKAAVWSREIHRYVVRMDQLQPRLFIGSLGGGVGTLAAFGEHGERVQRIFMQALGLGIPDIAWHTARDHWAEYAAVLSGMSATSAKIAREVWNLSRTEIGELEEPHHKEKIGSSTMPQKRNPSVCANILALERLVRQEAGLATELMIHEHERDFSCCMADWVWVPRISNFTARILDAINHVTAGLKVNTDRMEQNLQLTKGLICSEAVMMYLAGKLGRQTAHEVVHEASMTALAKDVHLREILRTDPVIRDNLAIADLDRLFDIQQYAETASAAVERVVQTARTGWARYGKKAAVAKHDPQPSQWR